MLLQEFLVDGKMFAIDYGNNFSSLWEEIPESKAGAFLRNHKGGGTAVVDGDKLKSCIYGATNGKYFKRDEQAVKLTTSLEFDVLREKYPVQMCLKCAYENCYWCEGRIENIEFDDIEVLLSERAQKYAVQITNVLRNYKWRMIVYMNLKPNAKYLEEANINKHSRILADTICIDDISNISYKICLSDN